MAAAAGAPLDLADTDTAVAFAGGKVVRPLGIVERSIGIGAPGTHGRFFGGQCGQRNVGVSLCSGSTFTGFARCHLEFGKGLLGRTLLFHRGQFDVVEFAALAIERGDFVHQRLGLTWRNDGFQLGVEASLVTGDLSPAVLAALDGGCSLGNDGSLRSLLRSESSAGLVCGSERGYFGQPLPPPGDLVEIGVDEL